MHEVIEKLKEKFMAIFNEKDIQELLEARYPEFKWNNKGQLNIDHTKTSSPELNNSQSFNITMLDTRDDSEFVMPIYVSDFMFRVFDYENTNYAYNNMKIIDDASNDWINILLDNYGKEYAAITEDYLQKEVNSRIKRAQNALETSKKKVVEARLQLIEAERGVESAKYRLNLAENYNPNKTLLERAKAILSEKTNGNLE